MSNNNAGVDAAAAPNSNNNTKSTNADSLTHLLPVTSHEHRSHIANTNEVYANMNSLLHNNKMRVYNTELYNGVRMASDWSLHADSERHRKGAQNSEAAKSKNEAGGDESGGGGASNKGAINEKNKIYNQKIRANQKEDEKIRKEHEKVSAKMKKFLQRTDDLSRNYLTPLEEKDRREKNRKREISYEHYNSNIFMPIQEEINRKVEEKTSTDFRNSYPQIQRSNFELLDTLNGARQDKEYTLSSSLGVVAAVANDDRTWKEKKDELWLSYLSEDNRFRVANKKYATNSNNGIFLDTIDETNYDPLKQRKDDTIYYRAPKGAKGASTAAAAGAKVESRYTDDEIVAKYNRLGDSYREFAREKNNHNNNLSNVRSDASKTKSVCTKSKDLDSGSDIFRDGKETTNDEKLELYYANTNNYFLTNNNNNNNNNNNSGKVSSNQPRNSTVNNNTVALAKTFVPFDFANGNESNDRLPDPRHASVAYSHRSHSTNKTAGGATAAAGSNAAKSKNKSGNQNEDGFIPNTSFLRKQSRAVLSIKRVENEINDKFGESPDAKNSALNSNSNNNNNSSSTNNAVMPVVALPASITPQQAHLADYRNRLFSKDKINHHASNDKDNPYNLPVTDWSHLRFSRCHYGRHATEDGENKKVSFTNPYEARNRSLHSNSYSSPGEQHVVYREDRLARESEAANRISDYHPRREAGGAAMVASTVPLFSCEFGEHVPPVEKFGKRMDIWM